MATSARWTRPPTSPAAPAWWSTPRPWIFGRKVLLPVGVVERVDHDEEKVYVDRTKDQIKEAPEFDTDAGVDDDYWDKLGGHYGDTYRTGM